MCQKTISMCQGKGSLSHNNRAFAAKNIDSSRTADNITFMHQNLRDAYDILLILYNKSWHSNLKDFVI